jgi:hypothetical protein
MVHPASKAFQNPEVVPEQWPNPSKFFSALVEVSGDPDFDSLFEKFL